MLIDIIAGARPNFMKIAPIIAVLRRRQAEGGKLRYRLVHTGQHFDPRMSDAFFRQLGIPAPDVEFSIGQGSAAEQTSAIMTRYEALLAHTASDCCLVVGDVTSTMACAIVAQKAFIPVAHVEAGIRSHDWKMPEEINRLVTDAVTNWFFTTSEIASQNLDRSGVSANRVFFVGNTMIDTLLAHKSAFSPPEKYTELRLKHRSYFVLTLHRPNNVDNAPTLAKLITAVCTSAHERPVLLPLHPRTARVVAGLTRLPSNLHLLEPQPYLQFNYMVQNAAAVITDSGGITEEATVLGVPCLTMRNSTERPETVEIGTNELVGTDPCRLAAAMNTVLAGRWKQGQIPPLWDGRASDRIVAHLEILLGVIDDPAKAPGSSWLADAA